MLDGALDAENELFIDCNNPADGDVHGYVRRLLGSGLLSAAMLDSRGDRPTGAGNQHLPRSGEAAAAARAV